MRLYGAIARLFGICDAVIRRYRAVSYPRLPGRTKARPYGERKENIEIKTALPFG